MRQSGMGDCLAFEGSGGGVADGVGRHNAGGHGCEGGATNCSYPVPFPYRITIEPLEDKWVEDTRPRQKRHD